MNEEDRSFSNASNEGTKLHKSRKITNSLIKMVIAISEKYELQLDKPEKVELKSFAIETPFNALLLLQDFLEDFFVVMIEYIDHLKALFNLQNENEEKSENSNYLRLEKELQKYEQKVREQIRIEQQLKLHSEMLQNKLEATIKKRETIESSLKEKIEELMRETDKNEKIIKDLQDNCSKLENSLKKKSLLIDEKNKKRIMSSLRLNGIKEKSRGCLTMRKSVKFKSKIQVISPLKKIFSARKKLNQKANIFNSKKISKSKLMVSIKREKKNSKTNSLKGFDKLVNRLKIKPVDEKKDKIHSKKKMFNINDKKKKIKKIQGKNVRSQTKLRKREKNKKGIKKNRSSKHSRFFSLDLSKYKFINPKI